MSVCRRAKQSCAYYSSTTYGGTGCVFIPWLDRWLITNHVHCYNSHYSPCHITCTAIVIVLETEVPYSFYTLLSMQQIVKSKEGKHQSLIYIWFHWPSFNWNSIIYITSFCMTLCITWNMNKHTRNLHTDILRMHPSLCGKQYLVHVHVNQLSVWGFTSSPLPLLDLPPEHLQYIQVHANCSLDRACLFSVCYFLELIKSAR